MLLLVFLRPTFLTEFYSVQYRLSGLIPAFQYRRRRCEHEDTSFHHAKANEHERCKAFHAAACKAAGRESFGDDLYGGSHSESMLGDLDGDDDFGRSSLGVLDARDKNMAELHTDRSRGFERKAATADEEQRENIRRVPPDLRKLLGDV